MRIIKGKKKESAEEGTNSLSDEGLLIFLFTFSDKAIVFSSIL